MVTGRGMWKEGKGRIVLPGEWEGKDCLSSLACIALQTGRGKTKRIRETWALSQGSVLPVLRMPRCPYDSRLPLPPRPPPPLPLPSPIPGTSPRVSNSMYVQDILNDKAQRLSQESCLP